MLRAEPDLTYGFRPNPSQPWIVDLDVAGARRLLDDNHYLADYAARLIAGQDPAELWPGVGYIARWVVARSLGDVVMLKPTAFRGACSNVCRADGRPEGSVRAYTWNPYFSTPYWTHFTVCAHPRHVPWTSTDPRTNPSHLDYEGPLPWEFRGVNTYAPEPEYPDWDR